jgi:hypothetical protein
MTAMFDRKGFIGCILDEVNREYKEVSSHGFKSPKALLVHVLSNLDGYDSDQPIISKKGAKQYLGVLFDQFVSEAGDEPEDIDDAIIQFQEVMGSYLNNLADVANHSVKQFEIEVHFIERHYRGDDRFECCIETVTHGNGDEFYLTYPLGATWEEALEAYPTFNTILEKISSLPEFNCDAEDIKVISVTGEQGLYVV